MATIPLAKIQLLDRWPGAVNPNMGIPIDGWDGTQATDATTPKYPIGEKRMAYSDHTQYGGWYTMQYLYLSCISRGTTTKNASCISRDFSDGLNACFHSCLTGDTADTTYVDNHSGLDVSSKPWYVVAPCFSSTDLTNGGALAYASACMRGGTWGWFWVGGVCPLNDVTLYSLCSAVGTPIEITTEAGMRRGPIFACQTAGTFIPASDYTIYGEATDVVGMRPMMAIGYADESA